MPLELRRREHFARRPGPDKLQRAPSRAAISRCFTSRICLNLYRRLNRLVVMNPRQTARRTARLGAMTLASQIPSIALGGVLADTLLAQLVRACKPLLVPSPFCVGCSARPRSPTDLDLSLRFSMLEITSRLESSARSSIIASVVEKDALPNAVTIVQITQYAGEVLAPFLFWLLADAGGGVSNGVSFSDGDSNTTATVTNGDNGKASSPFSPPR